MKSDNGCGQGAAFYRQFCFSLCNHVMKKHLLHGVEVIQLVAELEDVAQYCKCNLYLLQSTNF